MTVLPRLFHLQRDHDVTGVSGTGRVADGVLWPDGTVSIRWTGPMPSTVFWHSLANALHVHGHGGATRIVWADEQPPADRAAALREAAALLHQRASSIDVLSSSDFGEEARAVRELAEAAETLHRMAAETATTETTPDTCRSIDVDGQTISVRGSGDFTEQDREFFSEVVRAAKRRYAAEHPDEPAAEAQQDGAQQPGLRERHHATWNTLTPEQQATRLAELDADDEQDGEQP